MRENVWYSSWFGLELCKECKRVWFDSVIKREKGVFLDFCRKMCLSGSSIVLLSHVLIIKRQSLNNEGNGDGKCFGTVATKSSRWNERCMQAR